MKDRYDTCSVIHTLPVELPAEDESKINKRMTYVTTEAVCMTSGRLSCAAIVWQITTNCSEMLLNRCSLVFTVELTFLSCLSVKYYEVRSRNDKIHFTNLTLSVLPDYFHSGAIQNRQYLLCLNVWRFNCLYLDSQSLPNVFFTRRLHVKVSQIVLTNYYGTIYKLNIRAYFEPKYLWIPWFAKFA